MLDDYRSMRQVELTGLVVELPSVHPDVVLRERDAPWRELSFPIGQPEGVALAMAWQGVVAPRPLTHETFVEALSRFGVSLEVVRITGVEGRTYLAELVLVRQAERQVVPCRPSDALVLALRQPLPVPIMVDESLLAPADPAGSVAPAGMAPPPADPSPVLDTWPVPPWIDVPAESPPAPSGDPSGQARPGPEVPPGPLPHTAEPTPE